MEVLILGAGVSGLYIARQLKKRGHRAQLLEARDRIGGRLLTRDRNAQLACPEKSEDGWFDLGGTWFWSDQPQFPELLAELGIAAFEQHEVGHALEDFGPSLPPRRVALAPTERVTFRFEGGGAALCYGLAKILDPEQIHLETAATRIEAHKLGVRVWARDLQTDTDQSFDADHVIVTLPPQLARDSLTFEPVLPEEVRVHFDRTPTWMGHSMKCVVQYDRAFWREQGLSGIAVSAYGPVVAFHDAVAHGIRPGDPTRAALFGFFPPSTNAHPATAESQRAAVLQQLTRLFGPEAATPLAYFEHNWGRDRWTSLPHHHIIESDPNYAATALQRPHMDGRLLFAGTETAELWGGYLEGAVRSGDRVLRSLFQTNEKV